jgi:hypothetical protein
MTETREAKNAAASQRQSDPPQSVQLPDQITVFLAKTGFGPGGYTGLEVVYTPGIGDLIDSKAHLPLLREMREAGIDVPRGGPEEAFAIAKFLNGASRPLSPSLTAFLIDAAENGAKEAAGRKQGNSPLKNLGRDLALAFAVDRACELGGLRPTRNEASDGQSGCSVVADALRRIGYEELSEAGVVKAYRNATRIKKHGLPGYP